MAKISKQCKSINTKFHLTKKITNYKTIKKTNLHYKMKKFKNFFSLK